jgi:hypothetical protein
MTLPIKQSQIDALSQGRPYHHRFGSMTASSRQDAEAHVDVVDGASARNLSKSEGKIKFLHARCRFMVRIDE